jgi:hypothetical protein
MKVTSAGLVSVMLGAVLSFSVAGAQPGQNNQGQNDQGRNNQGENNQGRDHPGLGGDRRHSVPEPSTLALLGSGVAAIGGALAIRRKRAIRE